MSAMGGHQSAAATSTTWLTPQFIIDALGGWQSFDLDPCAAPMPRPWFTAWQMNAESDGDGLALNWFGRVFLNPPYSSGVIEAWLRKLADHGRGTGLIFARTETEPFRRQVWERASGLLFLHGRLFFHERDGSRAKFNGGAPSVLCAYGQEDLDILAASDLAGTLIPLRFARFVAIAGLDESWAEAMRGFLARARGPVSVSDAYRHFARHPKSQRNRHWREKVRQKLQECGYRTGRNEYVAAA